MARMGIALVIGVVLLVGCSDGRKIREWRPTDHDQPEGVGQVDAQGATNEQQGQEVAGDMLWRQQCARCHGRDGRGGMAMPGSGPVADLRVSTLAENEIIEVVTRGRRAMPAFGNDLDAESIRVLAKKVLSLRRRD